MSSFIKISRLSCCWKLSLQRILMTLTEPRTSALCVDCAVCSGLHIRWNDFLLLVFIFVVLVSFSWSLFFPTVLQMVQVHSSLCTNSVLYCLHPLSIWLLLFFSICHVYLCNVPSWLLVCWSVHTTILKQIYHHNSKGWCWVTQTKEFTLLLAACVSGVCLAWCPVTPNQMGLCLWAIKKICTATKWASCQPTHCYPTVCVLCSFWHLTRFTSKIFHMCSSKSYNLNRGRKIT